MDSPPSDELNDLNKMLCYSLRKAGKRSMATQYAQLMAANRKVNSMDQFVMGGQVYLTDQKVFPLSYAHGIPLPPLPQTLVPAFLAWQQSFKQMDRDLGRIEQTLASILLRAKDWQQVRDMFPDRLIRSSLNYWMMPICALQRMNINLYDDDRQAREDVWDKRLIDMYERVGGIIDLYLGYKLL